MADTVSFRNVSLKRNSTSKSYKCSSLVPNFLASFEVYVRVSPEILVTTNEHNGNLEVNTTHHLVLGVDAQILDGHITCRLGHHRAAIIGVVSVVLFTRV